MDSLVYIDDYYQGPRTPEQTREFEHRILNDQAFAEVVAFYLSSAQAVKQEQDEQQRARFREIYKQPAPAKIRSMSAVWRYVAAAAILAGIVFGISLFSRGDSHKQLAEKYIKTEFDDLSVNMGKQDSVQAALGLYNDGKYGAALARLQLLIQSDSADFEAIEYAGKSSLKLQQYDKALAYFKMLENARLQVNPPALLYQAVTLMKRSSPGDDAQAKQLLQQIVDKQLAGKETAKQWLDNW